MKHKGLLELTDDVGVCIKDQTGVVRSQNKKCLRLCGDRLNSLCENGCMSTVGHTPLNSIPNNSYSLKKDVFPTKAPYDAFVFRNGGQLITLLFDRTVATDEKMKLLAHYSLNEQETQVMRLVFAGAKNAEIAVQMGISEFTLKTLLNRIYKKLPEGVAKEIRKCRTTQEP